MMIQGKVGTGKTCDARIFVKELKRTYRPYNVNAVIARTWSDALAGLDGKPVQILVIDDPLTIEGMGYSTMRTLESYENFDLFYRIRHLCFEKSPNIKYVLGILLTQRLNSIDPNYRSNCNLIGFKTWPFGERDRKSIIDLLGKDGVGKQCVKTLKSINEDIYRHHDVKSKGRMVFTAEGDVRGTAYFPIEWIPQTEVFDVNNRHLLDERVRSRSEEKQDPKKDYRMMQVAVISTFRRFSQGTSADLVEFLRKKEGLKFDDKFAFEVMAFTKDNPEATITQIQEHFGVHLPPVYYKNNSTLTVQRTQSLDIKGRPLSCQMMIEKNQAQFEAQKQ